MGWDCPHGEQRQEVGLKWGRGGARRPPPQDLWTAVTQRKGQDTLILDPAFELSCCVP